MPMGLTSTHFISYREINVRNLDLIEDAWGFNAGFSDVISLLEKSSDISIEKLTDELIDRIRKIH